MAAEPDDSALAHFDPAGIIDALSTGLLILDAQLCVVHASVGAQDLLSLGLRQARGRHVGELFAQPQALIELLRRALEEVQVCSEHEFTLTTVAGVQALREPVVADLTVTPLDASITGPHLLVELADVRARARIWRETEMLSRVDGQRLMVRQLAHEIRNPLGGLRGAAQLLERELADPGLAEYTRVIIREADRLRALVESLLGPARAPRKLRLNIHEVCEHVWQLLRTEAAPGVVLERDYDPSLPEGRFDRDELVQALLNVGRNALQAVEGRGRIVLRTRTLGSHNIGPQRHKLVACVQVEDDGPGVPEEIRRTLFMPLVTAKAGGTGLGLAVAQDMVARHGGIIEFDSRPGHTVFSMLLPLEEAA
jgi:two-component system nitrogen regulation sensor histidine kinase GlnL